MSSRQTAAPFAHCSIGRTGRICYISTMPKTRKPRAGLLVPVVEEVPRISDAERQALRASLEKARADIAGGDYDVLTPGVLREEFEAVFGRGKSDKTGAASPRRPAAKRSRR
jgi:hypothetical protein